VLRQQAQGIEGPTNPDQEVQVLEDQDLEEPQALQEVQVLEDLDPVVHQALLASLEEQVRVDRDPEVHQALLASLEEQAVLLALEA
jgi:hypothetical protein